MEPVFTMHVVCDSPCMQRWSGNSRERDIDTEDIPIVTGREQICYEPYLWDETVIKADGVIYDAQGQAVGIFLQSYYIEAKGEGYKLFYREEKKERYELLLDHTLTIRIPTAYTTIEILDEYETDTCIYDLTLRK